VHGSETAEAAREDTYHWHAPVGVADGERRVDAVAEVDAPVLALADLGMAYVVVKLWALSLCEEVVLVGEVKAGGGGGNMVWVKDEGLDGLCVEISHRKGGKCDCGS
jgi:hypothetical protein